MRNIFFNSVISNIVYIVYIYMISDISELKQRHHGREYVSLSDYLTNMKP